MRLGRPQPLIRAMALVGALALATGVRAQDSEYRLKIQVPAIGLAASDEFDAAVLMDTPAAGVQGWSFGVTHDASGLELVSATAGAATVAANNGQEPEFSVIDTDPATDPAGGAGFTQAVVLNLQDRSVVLPAGNDQEIAVARYRVLADPTATEPCASLTVPLEFSDALANDATSPPVKTLLAVGGQDVPVELAGATIAVACPQSIVFSRCAAQDEDVVLEWVLSPDIDPESLDFVFLYRDGEFVETLETSVRSYFDPAVGAGEHAYTVITFSFDEAGDPSLVFGYCATTVTPVTLAGVDPAVGNWLGGETITITGTAFTTPADTSLALVAEGEDPLPLAIVEVVDATTMLAVTPLAPRLGAYALRLENGTGSAELADAFSYGFQRGEANADGAIDLTDATFVLEFLFTADKVLPPCRDAADTNDDGTLDLADATALLDFLFKGGDAPPPPFDGPGEDPTADDSLGCLE